MNSLSIVFFLPLIFLLLRSLSAVPNSFYFFVSHSSPTLSRSLLMQPPSQFRSSSPLFPLHYLGICSLCQFFISQLFYMTSSCALHQFLLRTFLHSNLHSHLIHFLVISSLNSHDYSYLVVIFSRKSILSPVVSLFMPQSLVHSCMPE